MRTSKIKKGNTSWLPASVTDVVNKDDGYRYRWSNKDPNNLAKKEQEGWETINGLQADKTKPENEGRIYEGKQMTSVYEKHDVILQRIPEELAQGRDEYFNGKSERQLAGLTAHVKKEIGKSGANTHGDITISSRRGEKIIE